MVWERIGEDWWGSFSWEDCWGRDADLLCWELEEREADLASDEGFEGLC